MTTNREWAQHIMLKSLCSSSREKINSKLIPDIKPEFFSDSLYRKSVRLIREHYDDTGAFYTWSEFLKLPELGDKNSRKLRGKEERRRSLCEQDDSLRLPSTEEQYRSFIRRIIYDAKQLHLIELQNEMSESLQTDEMTPEKLDGLVGLLRGSLDSIESLHTHKGTLFEINEKNVRDKIKEFYHNIKNNFFIPTGFKAFDEANIGIPLDSLFVMAAKSGCGKSSLALQYLINARNQGARCCLLPLEMSEEQMIIRLASNLLEVPANDIVKNLKKYYPKMAKAIKDFCVPKYDSDVGCLHFYTPDIEETLAEVLNKLTPYKYNIILVDYINLLSQSAKDKWESLYNDGVYGKRYASKNKTQIVFLAQLDDRTDEVRYSRGLKEHACVTSDSIIALKDGSVCFSDLITTEEKGFHKLDSPIEVRTKDGYSMVDTYYVNGEDETVQIILDNTSIRCTRYHKFMLNDQWIEAQHLRIGDYILCADGKRQIVSIVHCGSCPTYDLHVPQGHNYIVNNIVTHNSNMWTWNQTKDDIIENQRIDINQIKARNQNPIPFPLKANLACSKFTDWIEDVVYEPKKKRKALSKGFDSLGSDVPDD